MAVINPLTGISSRRLLWRVYSCGSGSSKGRAMGARSAAERYCERWHGASYRTPPVPAMQVTPRARVCSEDEHKTSTAIRIEVANRREKHYK
jgi:hypothetical protein